MRITLALPVLLAAAACIPAGAAEDPAAIHRRATHPEGERPLHRAEPEQAPASLPPLERSHPVYTGGLRVSGGAVAGIDKHKVSGVSQSLDPTYGAILTAGLAYDTSLDGGWGLAAIPTLYGREVRGSTTSGGVFTRDQMKSYGVRLDLGPAFTAGRFTLELTPSVGLGAGWVRTETSSAGIATRQTSGAGVVLDYGATAKALYLFNGGFYVGVSAGYDAYVTRVQYATGGPTSTVSGGGPIGELIIGFWY